METPIAASSATATAAAPIPASASKKFTNITDDYVYTNHHYRAFDTTVYLIRPPHSLSSNPPWITTRKIDYDNETFDFIFRHPLTSKLHPFTFPKYPQPPTSKRRHSYTPFRYYLSDLHPTTLSASYDFEGFGGSYPLDKLIVLPIQHSSPDINVNVVFKSTMLALYGGGLLQARGPTTNKAYSKGNYEWVNLSYAHGGLKFDDVVVFRGKIYAIDRVGFTKLINNFVSVRKVKIGKTLSFEPVTPGNSGRFGWRKRFVVGGRVLYLVVRMEERVFKVFRMKFQGNGVFWEEVKGFGGDNNQVLFMCRDHCFFHRASKKFPGREYKNCIVFSEAAFPQYGVDCWEFTWSDGRRLGEDDIAVFGLGDGVFARESEESGFPKIDWSPPAWMFNAFSMPKAEFQNRSVSECSGQSERDPEEDEGLNDGEVQSGLKDSNYKDDEQEEMETEFSSEHQDQDQEDEVEAELDNQDQEGEKMHCDSSSKEKEDVEAEVHINAITEDSESLQDDVCSEPGTIIVTQTPSLSATENDITTSLLSRNDRNDATEEETLRKHNLESVPKACTSSTTARHKSDSATTKFEGYDIRSDLVSTLQVIWVKHGNILEHSVMRNGDIIARALESLATMVHILDHNSAMSLNDHDADYLVCTLSDLRHNRFKVEWLIPFVENAEKLHKSKPLVESLNNLSQLSSQAKERKAILLDELAKLEAEENKRKEEMTKMSEKIPFCGQVKLDQPLGPGFTSSCR